MNISLPSFFKRAWSLIEQTYEIYDSRHGGLLAAAIAFYSLLSLAPLAVIAVAVAGAFIDPVTARVALERWTAHASSQEVAGVLIEGLEAARTQGTDVGMWVALAVLLLAASRLFLVLQDALNAVWDVKQRASTGAVSLARRLLAKRLLSFAMVVGSGGLMLATLVAQTLVTNLQGPLVDLLGLGELASELVVVRELVFAWIVLTVAIVAMFKLLPDAHVGWRAAIIGSAVTAVMVLIGTLVLGTYLSRIAPRWLQGAAGAVAAFMLWSYYMAQVFLLGAALTRVSGAVSGEPLQPDPDSEAVQ